MRFVKYLLLDQGMDTPKAVEHRADTSAFTEEDCGAERMGTIEGSLKWSRIFVHAETEDCIGQLLDIDDSRQFLQIRIARDYFRLLVFGCCIHNGVGHC